MEKEERLLPLPKELQIANQEVPTNYAPIYDEENFNEKHSIREYFIIVYKRLPLILALAVLVTATVAFYMYRQPSMFEAQTTIIIAPPKPKVQAKDSININFGGDANYTNTQLKLLQNPDLMREVVIRLGLHKDASLLNAQNRSLLGSLRSVFSSEKATQEKEATLPTLAESGNTSKVTDLSSLTPEERQRADAYVGTLLGGLSIEQIERTNLVILKVINSNPKVAARVADMTSQVFIEQNVERETQGAQKSLEDLSKSIEDLKLTIAQQEQERISYMSSSGLPLFEGKGQTLNAEKLSTVSGQWLAAIDERRKIEAEYEAATRASKSGNILPVVGDNKAILAAREQLLRRTADLEKRIEDIDRQIQGAEEKRSQLLVRYTPEYRDVQAVNEQIKSLTEFKEKLRTEVSQKIESEGKNLVKSAERETLSGLQARLQAAQNREQQLRNSYFTEVSSANQQGQAETRLTTLTQEIETNRGLLNTYTQRQKEQELAISGSRPDNITISSHAQEPGSPIGPQRNRNIIIAFLISMAAGIGLAFLIDYLDDSIKTSDDIGRHLGLPTLAMIPHHSLIDKRRGGNRLAIKNGNGTSSTALITLEDNRSPMAEAYRHLRTSLLFSSAGKPPQTILVTSSQPSEGKTTTAINTAVTLAQAGVEVVLLDCDLRRPRLHQHFSLSNATGLTNYLSGERNTDNLLKSYPGLPNLKIVTSGPIPPNPAELLSSNEMKNLLQFLRGNFKHVVIDSPPAISFTDAAIMATLVDGVVLVAMAGKSSIHLMRRFKHRLSNLGARIYGVVLNGIRPNAMEYGYYGYGYNYGSYYDIPADDTTTTRMEDETVSVHQTKN